MRELGLFCGTFNPVHMGHLLIAESARVDFKLETVYFVVSPEPPHRNVGLLAGEARYELVKAAVAENPCFQASDLELQRPGPSYTIDTVLSMRALYPDYRINLIIGSDNLPFLKDWHRAEELVSLVRLLVVPRLRIIGRPSDSAAEADSKSLPAAENALEKQATLDLGLSQRSLCREGLLQDKEVHLVDFPGVGISASGIRKRIGERKSILYMVPASVNRIILQKGYYAKNSKVTDR